MICLILRSEFESLIMSVHVFSEKVCPNIIICRHYILLSYRKVTTNPNSQGLRVPTTHARAMGSIGRPCVRRGEEQWKTAMCIVTKNWKIIQTRNWCYLSSVSMPFQENRLHNHFEGQRAQQHSWLSHFEFQTAQQQRLAMMWWQVAQEGNKLSFRVPSSSSTFVFFGQLHIICICQMCALQLHGVGAPENYGRKRSRT